MMLRAIHLLLCLVLTGFTHYTLAQGKQVLIPKNLGSVPKNNDFSNDASEYSNERSVQSHNIVIFWAKEYGKDPLKNKNASRRFDVKKALSECERFYDFYVNKMKIVKRGHSITDKYKVLFFVTGGNGSTAYGWGNDSVGMLWTPATRMSKEPYGVLAHELGHAFQYLASIDNGSNFNGPFNEMAAQHLLWHVYPQWIVFENYHLTAFLKGTHYAFLHTYNAYHSPFVLEYWAQKHGIDFYGRLLKNVKSGEDAVTVYKKLTGISQQKFNDEIFDASRKFITWDIKRIEKVSRQYANMHTTKMISDGDGWQRVAPENCPQNYGYNAIKLQVPKSKTVVQLEFEGIAGAKGYRNINVEQAGWRYGFVAVKTNGKRIYGKMHTGDKEKIRFKVPANTAYLWLVVTGAPKTHRKLSRREEDIEQWPYKIKLIGTTLSSL